MTSALLAAALAAPRINDLSAAELDQAFPGVGLDACEAVVAWREAHGDLEQAADLAEVDGLGDASRRLLTAADFSPASDTRWPVEQAVRPVDLNTASLAELAALPGIGQAKATEILRFREEVGVFASCEELAKLPGMGRATVAGLGELCTTGPPTEP